jgi:dTDP-4-dehydrorhamnose reductase
MVKALVTGAEGSLGRALRARLAASGDVAALGRAELDVTRHNDVVARFRELRPETVFHAAAYVDVDGCEVDRWRAYLANRDGADHVARAASEVGALMVYPGCDLVFDGSRSIPYREEDSPNPLSIYGDTKLAAELAIMKHGKRHLIVRSGPLFGPEGTNWLADARRRLQAGEPASGAEEPRCQPTSYADFADALVRLAELGETGLWHAASWEETNPFEFTVEAVRLLGGKPSDVLPFRRAGGGNSALRPRFSVLDCSRLLGRGIRMRSWREGLREAVASIKY